MKQQNKLDLYDAAQLFCSGSNLFFATLANLIHLSSDEYIDLNSPVKSGLLLVSNR